MEIVNLNCIRKICFVKKRKTNAYQWIETVTFSQWFKNLFRGKDNKLKNRYVSYYLNGYYHTKSEVKDILNDDNKKYEYNENLDIFFEKAHVVLKYSDSNTYPEVRYFNSNKEAEEFFKKLQVFAHDNNIPFINFEIENE